MKKASLILLGIFLFFPFYTHHSQAFTLQELQTKIENLLRQIQQIQEQIKNINQKSTSEWCWDFNKNLKIDDQGKEVEALHIALTKEGLAVNLETEKAKNEYGEATASAVSAFQEKYRSEILDPLGLKYPTGYAGLTTRKKLNSLYGCKNSPLPTISLSSSCQNFYWYDDNTNSCQGPKAFCGAYMYEGLRVFNTKEECVKSMEEERPLGYIKAVYEQNGKRYLDIDYVQWLTGKDAIRAAIEDGECFIGENTSQLLEELEKFDISSGYGKFGLCAPDGYYIRNQNSKIRTFEISNDVQIIMQTYGSGQCHMETNEKISYEIFKSFWGNNPICAPNLKNDQPCCTHLKSVPYRLRIQNGIVTKITEYYIP
ncbi:MAG: peptidoglycan-binding domain-containing protein [Minisyncoccia bacterium]